MTPTDHSSTQPREIAQPHSDRRRGPLLSGGVSGSLRGVVATAGSPPSARCRPVSLPDDVDDPSIAKASGRTVLPKHICWSGDPVYDLDDPEQRRLVYMKVLAEGLDRDVRHIIDVAELAALWPTLVLPAAVRDVWVPWFRDRGWLP